MTAPPPPTNVNEGAGAAAIGLDEDEEKAIETLHEIFPRVKLEFLRHKIEVGWETKRVINYILTEPQNVPMVERKKPGPEESAAAPEPLKKDAEPTNEELRVRLMRVFRQDKYRRVSTFQNLADHFDIVVNLLAKKFPRVHRKCIKFIVEHCASNYAPSYAILGIAKVSNQWPIPGKVGMRRLTQTFAGWKCQTELIVNITARATPKKPRKPQPKLPDVVQEQVDLIERLIAEPVPDEELAEADDDWDGPLFMCGVCFEEEPMTRSISCSYNDDHRFCLACVRNHAVQIANSSVAAATAGLSCLGTQCNGGYVTWEPVRDRIELRVRNRLDERFANDNINTANLENLVRCKYCNYAVVLDYPVECNKVFHCDMCKAEVCRLCGNDWDDVHFGRRCEEAMKASGAKAVRNYENLMADAIIRRCPRCRMPFNKIEGCNKMTCLCGLTQCYLCRESAIGYEHFCEHGGERDANGRCRDEKCTKKCTLRGGEVDVDVRRIQEVQHRVAEDERIAEELRVHGPIGGNAPHVVHPEDRPAAILAPAIVRQQIAGRPVAAQVAPRIAADVPRLPFV